MGQCVPISTASRSTNKRLRDNWIGRKCLTDGTPHSCSASAKCTLFSAKSARTTLLLVIWRRNRFQGTGSKVPKPVQTPGTRNRFLNIVSLTTWIICVLYESLFVNNESRNIGLKLMRLSFHFFTFSFIHLFIRCIYQQPNILARHWHWHLHGSANKNSS